MTNFSELTSYDGIVASWGYTVLLSEMTGSYQGDHHYLLQKGDQFAYLIIGYGSCSGCDHLQAITPWASWTEPGDEDYPTDAEWQPVLDYANELHDGVNWAPAEEIAAEIQKALDDPNGTHWWVYDSEIRSMLLSQFLPALVKPSEEAA